MTVKGSCSADLKNVVSDAMHLVSDAKSMKIVAVLNDLKQLKGDIASAKADCNQSTKLSTTCINDVQDIVRYAEDLYSQITAKQPNLSLILHDVENLVADAKRVSQDCHRSKSHKKRFGQDDHMCQKDVAML
jgi:hypothetical protein